MLENPAHAIPLWGLWQNYHRPNCSTLDGFSESVGDIGCRSLGNRIAGEDSARQGEGYPLGNMILMLVRTRFIWDSALFGRASLKSAKVNSSKGVKGVGMNGHGHVV